MPIAAKVGRFGRSSQRRDGKQVIAGTVDFANSQEREAAICEILRETRRDRRHNLPARERGGPGRGPSGEQILAPRRQVSLVEI